MSGTVMSKANKLEMIKLTPEMATELLEHNTHNRPISDMHVHRIAGQIIAEKWRFNGDTIKLADTGDVLDGQHRCWAVIEAKKSVETIIVRGIERDAFTTIDTVRRSRTGGDTIALSGTARYRNQIASALQWLLRWQSGKIENWNSPENRIENSDIEKAYAEHPQIIRAVERAAGLRPLANVGIVAFIYYILTNRNPELAERMMETLEEPAGVGVSDPFYRLRVYFTADRRQRKEPLTTICLAIKAANSAHKGLKIGGLSWKNQGKTPEAFPKLEV